MKTFTQWNEKDYDEFDETDHWNFSVILENCKLFTGERDGFSTPQNYLFR
jgi:hypothetical protein